ncbi:hypothetical protein F4823DRAFT_562852 [Ustulina deusta]|nr:hypothetical protein F4823DRAFT_562852 [Ustulina deusta]
MQDSRASLIASAFQGHSRSSDGDNTDSPEVSQLLVTHWLRGLPASVAGAMAAEVNATSLTDAVLRVATKQFSNLIMIASEFRMWFWTAFKVDVSFLDIVSSHQSLETLSEFVAGKLTPAESTDN